jgi:exonuclease VII large subunit
MPNLSPKKTLSWFNSTESLLVISSIGGSIASLVFQQVAFAAATSLSLSLAVGLNSCNNRRRLDEFSQQDQSIANKLEQQYSKEREFNSEAIKDLPNRSKQVDIEGRLTNLDIYNNQFANRVEGQIQDFKKQINNSLLPDLQHQFVEAVQLANQLQTSTVESTKLHQHLSTEIQSLNKQFQALDSKVSHLTSIDNYDIGSIHNEIKFIYELLGDIQKQTINSAQRTDNSLLLDLQHQIAQIQQLFNHLKASSEDSNQIAQHLAGEIQSLQEQVQSLPINVSKRLETVQAELQSRFLTLEKSDCKIRNNIYELSDLYRQLSTKIEKSYKSKPTQLVKPPVVEPLTTNHYTCEHCRKDHKNNPIQGGDFGNYKFCSRGCKHQYENINNFYK